MKKIFLCIMCMFLLVGCSNYSNTPSKKVEDFLGKYQKLDDDVLTQLQLAIESDSYMSEEQKKSYKSLMERQYQNLSYKIKDEKVNGDTATVDVEVEVFDYQTSITKSREYYEQHKEEFKEKTDDKEVGEAVEESIDTTSSFIDYKLKELKNVDDKTTYTITFNLSKNNDNEWVLEDLSDSDREKLHGMY